jgi:predicted transcriptional regulator
MNKSISQKMTGKALPVGKPGLVYKQAQDQIKALKNGLNLSDETMANAIGVPLPQMVVMLYGPPAKIPAKIAEKIRVLEAINPSRNSDPEIIADDTSDEAQPSVSLRPDQQELMALQKSLGLTHDDLARIAGIPRSRMMTYVYGRTRSIPAAVLDALRQVRDRKKTDDNPYLFDAIKEMEGSLPEFIARWQARLNIKSDDLVETGKAMGVSKSTLLRWMAGDCSTRPSFVRKCLTALHEYEQGRVRVAEQNESNQ